MAGSRSLRPHTPRAGYGIQDPRDVVCARLAEQATRISRLDTQELDTTGLSGRDAALAHAIYDAAIRRWLTISRLVGTGISRPFKECQPEVQASLACGAAQMLFLDRVPDHAAVSLAVEWASRHCGRKVGGFVNAGLRRLAELRGPIRERWSDGCDEIPLADGRALGLTRPILPRDDATARLSIATSHSRAFIARWINAFGVDQTRRIALHSIRSAPTIINAVHATAPIEPGADLEPHEQPGHYVHHGDRAGLIDLLAAQTGLRRLDESEEYLTSDRLIDSPFVKAFEILAELPNNEREIRRFFRGANFGQLEVKCRHIPIQADVVRRRLSLEGDQPGVLIFARLSGKARALVCRRPESTDRVAAQARFVPGSCHWRRGGPSDPSSRTVGRLSSTSRPGT
ncbi:MAG: hypothetical protein IH985_08990 [Planctomycetes bacterium]|nr:hypothetical protein [Planctomycetota bacterium]